MVEKGMTKKQDSISAPIPSAASEVHWHWWVRYIWWWLVAQTLLIAFIRDHEDSSGDSTIQQNQSFFPLILLTLGLQFPLRQTDLFATPFPSVLLVKEETGHSKEFNYNSLEKRCKKGKCHSLVLKVSRSHLRTSEAPKRYLNRHKTFQEAPLSGRCFPTWANFAPYFYRHATHPFCFSLLTLLPWHALTIPPASARTD